MYVRTKKINGSYYNYLVESVREGKKVVQKHIKYLGKTSIDLLLPKYEIKKEIKNGKEFYKAHDEKGKLITSALYREDLYHQLRSRHESDFVEACINQNVSIRLDNYDQAKDTLNSFLFDDKNSSYYLANENYLGDDYLHINQLLRKGKFDYYSYGSAYDKKKLSIQEDVKKLDKLTKLFSVKKDTVVWRGASNKFTLGLKVGDTFTDKGIGSVSLNKSQSTKFERGNLYRIVLKKGTLVGIGNSGEMELLIPRNTTYKITKWSTRHFSGRSWDSKRTSGSYRFVDLEIIGGKPSGKKR